MWGTPLKDVFPELFGIASNKDSSVAELLSPQGMVSIGMLILFVWCKTGEWRVVTFLDLIYSGLVRGNRVDQLYWKPSASGVFDVKPFYKVLCSSTHSFFPWKP